MDQRRPPVRPSCATTNAASTTTAETKTKTSNELEEKLVYYILFDCSPSDERARTMTMYYLPSPEFLNRWNRLSPLSHYRVVKGPGFG